MIEEQAIRDYLPQRYRHNRIVLYESADSTNNRARELVLAGAPHGTLVMAECQMGGKGRMGRSFFSPPDSGVYMTAILRNVSLTDDTLPVTAAAGIAVCDAVSALSGGSPRIKWVNDVFLENRKICGILAEGMMQGESNPHAGFLPAVVVGIGVNLWVDPDSLPVELKDVVGGVFPFVKQEGTGIPAEKTRLCNREDKAGWMRERMAAEILSRFLDLSDHLGEPELLAEYKRKSLVLGNWVEYKWNGQLRRGKAIDIHGNGSLVVQEADGGVITLGSGEVSVRPVERDETKRGL